MADGTSPTPPGPASPAPPGPSSPTPPASPAAPPPGEGSFSDRFPALRGLRLGGRQRRIPQLQQTAATDCGPACLTMVLGYFGKSVRLEDVRSATGFSRLGTDALTLVETARFYGLRGRGIKIRDIDALRFLEPASILHWRFNHFLGFLRIYPHGAAVGQPAARRRP